MRSTNYEPIGSDGSQKKANLTCVAVCAMLVFIGAVTCIVTLETPEAGALHTQSTGQKSSALAGNAASSTITIGPSSSGRCYCNQCNPSFVSRLGGGRVLVNFPNPGAYAGTYCQASSKYPDFNKRCALLNEPNCKLQFVCAWNATGVPCQSADTCKGRCPGKKCASCL